MPKADQTTALTTTQDEVVLPSLEERLQAIHPTPRDRELVRTTFQLTDEALDARAWLSGHHSISMAEAINRAIAIVTMLPEDMIRHVLPREDEERIRRSMALSKGGLKALEAHAKKTGLHRDDVLEVGLQLQSRKGAEEAKETAELHRQALPILERVGDAINRADRELRDMLGTDDPVYLRLTTVSVVLDNLIMAIEDELGAGTPVNPNDL